MDLELSCTADRDDGVRFVTRFKFVTVLSLTTVIVTLELEFELEFLPVSGLSGASSSVLCRSRLLRRRCRKWLF